MASPNDVTPPDLVPPKKGWFSRLKTWQKVLFVLVWPVSGAYGLYWMWKQERFSQPVRVALTALFAIAFLGYLAFYVSTAGRTPGASTASSTATATVAAASAEPSAEPSAAAPSAEAPSPTAAPEAEKAPEDLLAEKVRAKLGESNRGVERVSVFEYERETLTITYAINENLSSKLISTGAAIDASEILELTRESGLPMRLLQLKGTYSMVDKLGNAKEAEVINALYSGETLGRINFENFLFKNVWEAAESAVVHPEFRLQ